MLPQPTDAEPDGGPVTSRPISVIKVRRDAVCGHRLSGFGDGLDADGAATRYNRCQFRQRVDRRVVFQNSVSPRTHGHPCIARNQDERDLAGRESHLSDRRNYSFPPDRARVVAVGSRCFGPIGKQN
jgi:hypothetical protein